MGNCGSRPKVLAIGIAPLGIISIGVVPMGVVSIGVVPMGVLSVGAVAMGVLNLSVVGMGILVAGVNVMGVWWTGLAGMGPYRLGGVAQHRHLSAPAARMAYPSESEAREQAEHLGCSGVHRMGQLWMPCSRHSLP